MPSSSRRLPRAARAVHAPRVLARSALAVAALLAACARAPHSASTGPVVPPPEVRREFRGVWVATVGNIDWPSRAGLPTAQQQAELVAIMERARALNLNAVVFQVRPAADALYDSPLEPWSEYLTGTMGRAPSPYYDPLAFAVAEAHKRGLELHAWLNPYRARTEAARLPAAPTHVTLAAPELVRAYNRWRWMDPGEPGTMARSLAVVRDVVRRYDIDGVHIDDYFYPYPEDDPATKKPLDFPDSASYARYVAAGGTKGRADWRRENVDNFVHAMFDAVRQEKPWVKVGVSPFGIYRPGSPPNACCFDAYAKLYADARRWWREGWLDYLAPQLYWKVSAPKQSYPELLAWWAKENVKGRHLWPGNYLSRVGSTPSAWAPAEIDSQIALTRAQPGATGNVHFSMVALLKNQGGVSDSLLAGAYAMPALVPETPWLPGRAPGLPVVAVAGASGAPAVTLAPAAGEGAPWQWVVRARQGAVWRIAVLPGARTRYVPPGFTAVDEALVSGVDRTGREGPAARAAAPGPVATR